MNRITKYAGLIGSSIILTARLWADPIIISVDVGLTRLVHFNGDFDFDPPAGLGMNGQQVTIIYQLSRPVRVFTQTQNFFVAARFDTNNEGDFVHWGPITGQLLDSNGNAICSSTNVIAGGGDHGFEFGPLWYPIAVPSEPRPFVFYGISFNFTMPNDPTHQIIASKGYDLRIGDDRGYFGIGFGKTDITGPPGVPESGATAPLLGIGLALLAWIRRNHRQSEVKET
jgi:hypothetical protein